MNEKRATPEQLFVISAIATICLGVALALSIIAGIWTDFESRVIGKTIGTLTVLFLLSGFFHVVAKAACDKPNGKP